MIYLGVLLSLGLMAAMISVALHKKSNLYIRIASLGALALMLVTIIICLFIVFTDNRVVVDESVLIVGAPVIVEEPDSNNVMVLFLFIIFLVIIFTIVAVYSLKEHRRQKPKIRDIASDL